jgi:hypothetical protein
MSVGVRNGVRSIASIAASHSHTAVAPTQPVRMPSGTRCRPIRAVPVRSSVGAGRLGAGNVR